MEWQLLTLENVHSIVGKYIEFRVDNSHVKGTTFVHTVSIFLNTNTDRVDVHICDYAVPVKYNLRSVDILNESLVMFGSHIYFKVKADLARHSNINQPSKFNEV